MSILQETLSEILTESFLASQVKQHAVDNGAMNKSNVAVFNTKNSADSYAEKSQHSKGGAFIMKHFDHPFYVVVSGADSQRMAKNGYEYVK